MDLKVSRKETRMQPSGTVEVLTSNVFDLYPVYSPTDPTLIMDVEMLDNDRTELLDRAMFASVKQRGADPLEITDGVQWAEAVLGEVPVSAITVQIQNSVSKEGPGVQTSFTAQTAGDGKQYFQYSVSLTDAT